MKKANSRYEIHVRYRTPKRGKKSPRFGDLKREDARKLSVYIRERASVKEARLKQERDARWREEYIEDRIKRGIEKALEEMELK